MSFYYEPITIDRNLAFLETMQKEGVETMIVEGQRDQTIFAPRVVRSFLFVDDRGVTRLIIIIQLSKRKIELMFLMYSKKGMLQISHHHFFFLSVCTVKSMANQTTLSRSIGTVMTMLTQRTKFLKLLLPHL